MALIIGCDLHARLRGVEFPLRQDEAEDFMTSALRGATSKTAVRVWLKGNNMQRRMSLDEKRFGEATTQSARIAAKIYKIAVERPTTI